MFYAHVTGHSKCWCFACFRRLWRSGTASCYCCKRPLPNIIYLSKILFMFTAFALSHFRWWKCKDFFFDRIKYPLRLKEENSQAVLKKSFTNHILVCDIDTNTYHFSCHISEKKTFALFSKIKSLIIYLSLLFKYNSACYLYYLWLFRKHQWEHFFNEYTCFLMETLQD